MKNKVTAKIRKLNVQLVKKDNTNNFTSSIENGNNNMKTAKLKNQKLNTFVNVLEKKGMPSKEDIKNQKQNEINEIISPATITKSVSKLCSKQNLTDYSIAHDNTKALHSSITKGQSCTNKNTARSKSSHKTLHENNNFIATGFKQKTKETLSTKNNHAHLQPKTNQDDILKKKMEKLRKTNEDLETKYLKLKNQMKDKERIINDLMNFNMELQSKVIDEYPKLYQINEEIQIKVLSNFNELMHLMSEYFKRHPMKHEDRVGDLPVGYRNIERNEIHLGYGVYICARQYDAVCVISKTMPQFVKNLAIAVFGIKTLKESSVTGARSNRNKNKTQETARPALDSTKLQALRAAVKHYAMSERGQDEITADYEAQQIGTHIAHKIYELNNPPNRNKAQHKKVVSAQVCEVMNNFENTSNDPNDSSVPNNDNSNASSSLSVTEMNNSSKEHGPLFETSLSDGKNNECNNVTFSDKENDEEESSIVSSTIHDITDTSRNSIHDNNSD
ncbi:putative leucine-rich repeat-containing protein DDB_G0290503 [Linepithema humile]|uniref:putative leucine-rich repeat-containing protein DDB_G0290503 n=1 Tax=Linepithema humile TaxID=83485 RepID=UPI00351F6D05